MIQVAMHTFKGSTSHESVDHDLTFARAKLPEHVQGRPTKCGKHVMAQFSRGCLAYHLGRLDDALELLTAACETAGAMYTAVSSQPGAIVTFPFRGRQLSGPSGPPEYLAGSVLWVTDLCLALALRRRDIINILVKVPMRAIEKALGGRSDECFTHLVDALQDFLTGKDPGKSLVKFERLSQPENLKVVTPAFISRFRGMSLILKAIAAKDQASFDQSLVAKLTEFKKAHSRGTAASDPNGLIDLLASGMAVLAQECGLQLNVASVYIPSWLIAPKI
jgi:hypothetical protein